MKIYLFSFRKELEKSLFLCYHKQNAMKKESKLILPIRESGSPAESLLAADVLKVPFGAAGLNRKVGSDVGRLR